MAKDQDTVDLAIRLEALAARQEVLSIALREVLGALPPSTRTGLSGRLRDAVQAFVDSRPVTLIPQADEAIAEEIAALLHALSSQPA